jgi:hypothetical protein
MVTLHWIGALVVLALIGGFLVFAFRQGMAVKPRRSDTKLWWQPVPPDGPDEDDKDQAGR